MAVSIALDVLRVDVTLHSNTIPTIKEYEVNREYIIKNIEDTFSTENKVILLEGEHNSRKTTLLVQFARKHKNNCISFFIGEDYWKSNVNFFLSELCIQMASLSSDGLKNRITKYKIDEFA